MKQWIRQNFASALAHLDLRIHREILRLRATYQLTLDEFRGLYISDNHVDSLINNQLQQYQARHPETASLTLADIDQLQTRINSLKSFVTDNYVKDTAWKKLQESFSLTAIELDVILIALAPELDSKYETLYAYLNNDITRKYPTVELIMRFAEPGSGNSYRQALNEHAKLCATGLLNVREQNTSYQMHAGIFLAKEVIDFLLYDSPCEPDATLLRALTTPFQAWDGLPFPAETVFKLQSYSQQLDTAENGYGDRKIKLLIRARKNSAALMLLTNVFSGANIKTLVLDLATLFEHKDRLRQSLNHISLYLSLHRVAVIIDFQSINGNRETHGELTRHLFDSLFNRVPLLAIVVAPEDWRNDLLCHYPFHHLALQPPGVVQRKLMWQQLAHHEDISLEESDTNAIAEFFNLDYQQIAAATRQLKLQQKKNYALGYKDLVAAATAQSYSEIAELAIKVNNSFGFDELILPADTRGRIKEIIFGARNRQLVFDEWGFAARTGNVRGLMALFAGASGTGKTMSASVIANELGLDLYRVDLSRVVSKYIGETEKNLDKIFNAAHQANCILFIDEADALLGKRSEVKDAHDRNANVEVAFLLQKMESHDGLVILTTNLAKNIDQAFTRRLQFVVDFPKPDELHRELIWKNMFGDKAPLHSDVDFNFLARQFNNTGGDIKNIALDAALLAAESEHKLIDMPLLIRACARQMIKQGKVPSATEFKHFFALVGNN
jgi:hypothetical protein